MKAVHARRASGESLRAIARDLGVSAGLFVKRGKEEAPPRTKVLRAVDAYPVARCESCSALKGIQAWILVPSLRLD